MKSGMNIFFAASECTPFAKTGGLADVVGSLPRELASLGNRVSVIMPYYRSVRKNCPDAKETGISLQVTLGESHIGATVLKHTESGVTYYFIRNDKFYDRDALYGNSEGDYPDNATRFIFCCKSALMLINRLGEPADIIHCHDWQTGIIPALIRYGWRNLPALRDARTIFTIHNLAFQGKFWYYDLKLAGLPDESFTMEGLEFYGDMNMMKAGIVYSDVITTVSEKYAEEIQTKEFGCGLEGVLAKRASELHGILNGVDYNVWSPENDKFIATKFSVKNPEGKKECRKDLLKMLKINDSDGAPVIGAISRLTEQKGFDLIAKNMNKILKLGAIFVLLGTGEKEYNELFAKIAKKNPKTTGIRIAFDEELAHKIEAGSDIFLMPSRYEPCGLNQMYSLRYGTIPVVRATGGLDDTIANYNPKTRKGNGFKFEASTPDALMRTIKRAVKLYRDGDNWPQIVKNAMLEDFSWTASAKKYNDLYKNAPAKS